MVTIEQKESDFLNSLKFICSLTIVMVHCPLHDLSYIAPHLTNRLRLWHESLHFGEPSLILFFVISGYLFFRSAHIDSFSWKDDYLFKVINRIKRLLCLYVVWNTVGFVFKFLIYNKCPSSVFFVLSGYNPFSPGNYHGRGLWFLESLIVFTLLSPLYYYAVRYLKHLVLPLSLLFSLTSIRIDYLYFNVYLLLGCYLACMGIKLTEVAKLFNWKVCLLLLLLLQFFIKPGLISIPLAGELIFLLFFSALAGLLYDKPIPVRIARSSTFIYVAHFYFVIIWRWAFLQFLPANLFGYVTNMILNCVLSACTCVLVYCFVICKFDILNLLFAGGRITKK